MHADLLQRSLARIDRANADDPNSFGDEPLAQMQGRRAHAWVLQLDPAATGPLQVAARAHHLRRWELARTDYPEGRDGYLRWRRDQKTRHATLLTEVLIADDVPPRDLTRAVEIVKKQGLGTDAEVQMFEDAVCLTFIETQFLATADKIADDDKMVDVVAKTLKKMSPAGHAAAATIALDERSAGIIRRATARLSA